MPETMTEMMVCEKMHARIPVATCAGRQTKGVSAGRDNGRFVYMIPYECRDCEAGRAALAGAPPKIEEEPMSVTRACANCGRVLTVVAEGCCFVCYTAGKGLEGEAKAAARVAVKARIESGEFRSRGKTGPRKFAPAAPAAGAPSAGETAKMSPEMIAAVRTQARVLGELVGPAPAGNPAEIPVTIRLMIEVSVRVLPIAG